MRHLFDTVGRDRKVWNKIQTFFVLDSNFDIRI